MKRVYPAIVPAPSSLPVDAGKEEKEPSLPIKKKKRINVLIACNNCRAKKAACNGERPVCYRCQRLGKHCKYAPSKQQQDDAAATSSLLRQQIEQATTALQQHADVIERLRSAPEHEAAAVLARLRSTADASAALSALRTSVSPNRLPERRTARAVVEATDTEVEFELTVHHKSVYPALSPIDVLLLDLNNLVRPNSGSPSSPGRSTASFVAEQNAISMAVKGGAIDPSLLVTQPSPSSSSKQATPLPPLPSHPSPGGGSPQKGRSGSASSSPPPYGPQRPSIYCDARLQGLDLRFWTAIRINSDFAARAISHYLETDHPHHGWFDTDLFLNDLAARRLDHCSAFLVSSLLCIACVCYTCFDTRAATFSRAFFREAELLWKVERATNGVTTLAAINMLAMAAAYIGKDTISRDLVVDARAMAEDMELFGVPRPKQGQEAYSKWSEQRVRSTAHVAWGTYAWLTFHATFFKGDPIPFPPALPIPGDETADPVHHLPPYMGHTFPSICRFWVIVQEVLAVYIGSGGDAGPILDRVPLAFAESRYQKILALADNLDRSVSRDEHSAPHVLIFQTLYHISVLDIFRPFIKGADPQRLMSFTSLDASPDAVFGASLNQLKRIVLEYRIRFQRRQYSGWLNAAAQHVCNAIIRETDDPTWRFYFLLCMGYWKESVVAFPVMTAIVKANLSLALSTGCVTSAEAQTLLKEVEFRARHHDEAEAVAVSAVADFERAVFADDRVRIDELGQQFEALTWTDRVD